MLLRLLMISALGLLSACSDKQAEPGMHKTRYHNDYSIGRFTAPDRGFDSNSFWIKGPVGVILIGTQFLPSAALQAVKIAESVTGKKVVMAIVLHATPDQFNGTEALQQRGIRVVSAKAVVDEIPTVDAQSRQTYFASYQPDYPVQLVLPEALWDKTQEFDAAGLHLKAYVIRGGVSQAHVLIELDDHLFVGDLVVNGYHASMQQGMSREWLERLDEIRKFSHHGVIHPGRGYAMNGDELLNQQDDYLHYVQKAVARQYAGAQISPGDTQAIISDITRHYPGYGLPQLLDTGVPAEWNRLRQEDHKAMMMEENPR